MIDSTTKSNLEIIEELKKYLKDSDWQDLKGLDGCINSTENDDVEENEVVAHLKDLFETYKNSENTIKWLQDLCRLYLPKYPCLEKFCRSKTDAQIATYKKLKNFQRNIGQKFIDEYAIKNFENALRLFNEYKYDFIKKPEIFEYEEFIDNNDSLVLKAILELEELKNFETGTSIENEMNIIRKYLPKLAKLNYMAYKKWCERNKEKLAKFTGQEVLINYNFIEKEAKIKICEILNLFQIHKTNVINLNDFNSVSTKIHDINLSIENWLQGLLSVPKNSNFKEYILPIYFNLLKRCDDWKDFVNAVNNSLIASKGPRAVTGSFSKKSLFYMFYRLLDNECKLKIIQLYSEYNPAPLVYPSFDLNDGTDIFKYEINENLYYCINGDNIGVLSFGIGPAACEKSGKSSLLNKIFLKEFETDDYSVLSTNTIDIDLDTNTRGSRNLVVADCHGIISTSFLKEFFNFFKFLIIHINASDLKENNFQISDKIILEALQNHNKIIFLIRDTEEINDSIFKETSIDNKLVEDKFKFFKEASNLQKLDVTYMALRNFKNLGKDDSINIQQKLEKYINDIIYKNKCDDCYLNKKAFLKLLSELKIKNDLNRIYESINDLRTELLKYSNNFYNSNLFPGRCLLKEIKECRRNLLKKLPDDIHTTFENQKNENIENLKKLELSEFMKKFCNLIVKQKDWFQRIIELTNEIKYINISNTEYLVQEKQDYEKNINEDEFYSEKLKSITEQIDEHSISIDVILRELTTIYIHNPNELKNYLKLNNYEHINEDFVIFIKEFIDKGEPFELIDGDNLNFNYDMLLEIFRDFKNEKACVISILGPQSSGKSTLLNYLFGCKFASSVGRCTKGIYIAKLKIKHPDYNYLIILDCEGLQGSGQKDEEFDRKITLFCLAISKLLIINIKGDMQRNMRELLEICIYNLAQLNRSKMPAPCVFMVFNQNPVVAQKGEFIKQIADMTRNIIGANDKNDETEIQKAANILNFQSNPDKIHVLSNAFNKETFKKDDYRGFPKQWCKISTIPSFSIECIQLLTDILRRMEEKNEDYSNFYKWLEMTKDIWQTIDMFSNLLEFANIMQLKQNKELKNIINSFFENVNEIPKELSNFDKEMEESVDSETKVPLNDLSTELKDRVESFFKELTKTYSKKFDVIVNSKALKYYKNLIDIHKETMENRIETFKIERLANIRGKIHKKKIEFEKENGISVLKEAAYNFKSPNNTSKKDFEETWKDIIEHLIDSLCLDEHEKNLLNDIYQTYNESRTLLPLQTSELVVDILKHQSEDGDKLKKILKKYLNEKRIYREKPNFAILATTKLCEKLERNSNYVHINKLFDKKKCSRFIRTFNLITKMDKNKLISTITGILNCKSFIGGREIDKNKRIEEFQKFCSELETIGLYIHPLLKDAVHDSIKIVHNSAENHFQGIIQYKFNTIQAWVNFNSEICKIDECRISPYLRNLFPNLEDHIESTEENNKLYGPIILFTNLHENIVRKSIFQNDKAMTFLEDPIATFDKCLRDQAIDQMHLLCKQITEWDQIFNDIEDKVNKNVKPKEKSNNEWYNVTDFSAGLVKRLREDVNNLIDSINHDLEAFFLELDRYGACLLHLFALIRCWYKLAGASIEKLKEPTRKLEEDKQQWKEWFEKTVNGSDDERSISNANSFFSELNRNIKTEMFENAKVEARRKMEEKKDLFNTKRILTELDEYYFVNFRKNYVPIGETMKYIRNQNEVVEQHFEKIWEENFENIKGDTYHIYRNKLLNFYDQLHKRTKTIDNVLKIYHEKPSYELFDDKNNNLSLSYTEKSKKQKYNFVCFELYMKILKNESIDKETIFHYDEESYQINESIDVFNQFNLSQRINTVENLPNFTGKYEIPILSLFNNKLSELAYEFREKLTSFAPEDWTFNTLELCKTYDTYKGYSIGCKKCCKFCGRKCDQLHSAPNELHDCDLGHHIRGMNGIMMGENRLSMNTCEEIADEDVIKQRSANNFTCASWKEIRNYVGVKGWNLQYKPDKGRTIRKYIRMWEADLGKHIVDYWRKELRNENLKHDSPVSIEYDSMHFIFCLDYSGSMKGDKWNYVKSASVKFVNSVKQQKFRKKAISLILFNKNANKRFDYMDPSTIKIEEYLKFKSGGTDFGAPLKEARELIKKHPLDYDHHIILFYTDGEAPFPTGEIKEYESINPSWKDRIQFIAVCEMDKPGYLQMVVNEFNKILKVSRLYKDVSPKELTNKLPEIISNFHRINTSEY